MGSLKQIEANRRNGPLSNEAIILKALSKIGFVSQNVFIVSQW